MVGRKLATLVCGVLLFWSTQVERAHTPRGDAPVLVHNNLGSPPAAMQATRHRPTELRAIAESIKASSRNFLTLSLKLPTKFMSWSHNVKSFLDMPSVQQNCLTTAVYFESRSESALGQLAVALVVLNRAKSSNYSVCGVVYRGANRLNACQFSFACDGKPDVVDDTRAWDTAVGITNVARTEGVTDLNESMQVLTIATNYHADYINPKWSKQLTRLTKIGRHIFYYEHPVLRIALVETTTSRQ